MENRVSVFLRGPHGRRPEFDLAPGEVTVTRIEPWARFRVPIKVRREALGRVAKIRSKGEKNVAETRIAEVNI